MKRHHTTGRVTIPFTLADIDVPLPAAGLPVLNRGAGPTQWMPRSPPPPASPPPPPAPPAPPAVTCPVGAQCCLNGVSYSSCLDSSTPGVPTSVYYSVASGVLSVALK